MRVFATLLVLTGASLAFGQDAGQVTPIAPTPQLVSDNAFTSFASQFFEGDFVNYYAFVNGVFDSTQATLQGQHGGGGGFDIGGGVTASKHFAHSQLSLTYRGDYRDFAGGYQGSGTDQYLNALYSKQFSRRWSLSVQVTGGELFYSNGFYNTVNSSGIVQTNPFSPTSRFLSGSVYMNYQQTRRLRYTLGGTFFLNRYSFPGSFGSTGGIGSFSTTYQLTARTTVGGTYSHDNFHFQRGVGDTSIDGGYGSVTHIFGRDWNVSLSAGITSARTSGTISTPVSVIIPGLGQTVIGYAVNSYNVSSIVPTVQGSVSHVLKRFVLTGSAGHGVNPGNGTYLTSSHTFYGAAVSRALSRQSALGATTSYSRIVSIANQISQSYIQSYTSVSYSRIIYPHLSAYVAYNYNHYGSLLGYHGAYDNRFIAGLSYSSKSIPLTIF